MDKPICLFDSGIGGLTVLKKLLSKFPNEEYIYFSDLARVPFGDRTKEDIQNIAAEIIEWLIKFNPKLIIMACNTSSSVLFEKGNIYGMIKSCAKGIASSNFSKVTIWATKLVVESNAYKKEIQKINPDVIVEEVACPKLVPMIEDLNCSIENKKLIISEYLEKTSKDSQALILGCTHYPLIQNELSKLTKLKLIDPTDYLLQDLEKYIYTNGEIHTKNQVILYTTAQKEKVEKFASLYLGTNYKVNLVSLDKVNV